MEELMTSHPSGRKANPASVRQLRVVVQTGSYEQAVRFYRDVLGLREELAIDSDGGARVTVLAAGRATLELVNPAQCKMIDQLEVGRQVRGGVETVITKEVTVSGPGSYTPVMIRPTR
jgi:catechol 2,3-dioxygenase-like lactoylglutathione lyase family enzyme